jgi:hypothetical protein
LRDCHLLLERCVVLAVSSSPLPSSSLSHYSLLLLSSPYLAVPPPPLSLSLSRSCYLQMITNCLESSLLWAEKLGRIPVDNGFRF